MKPSRDERHFGKPLMLNGLIEDIKQVSGDVQEMYFLRSGESKMALTASYSFPSLNAPSQTTFNEATCRLMQYAADHHYSAVFRLKSPTDDLIIIVHLLPDCAEDAAAVGNKQLLLDGFAEGAGLRKVSDWSLRHV